MSQQSEPGVTMERQERSTLRAGAEVASRLISAGLFAGTCAVGALAISEQLNDNLDLVDVNLENGIVIKPDSAQPSDVLNDVFDGVTVGGAALGSVILAKRAGRQVRLSLSKKEQAITELAHVAGSSAKPQKLKAIAAVSMIGAGAGIMTGGFIDIARGVSNSQTDVSGALFSELAQDDGGDNFLITNTPTPELANVLNLPNETVESVLVTGGRPEYNDIVLAPMRMEWHAAFTEGSTNKVQVLAAGMPSEATNLPLADTACERVPVIAAEELGLESGQSMTIDGLPVVVHDTISDSAGLNLLPVIMNNEDFARCLQTNPEQPFNMVFAHGEQETIQRLLQEAESVHGNDSLANRVFLVPQEEFMSNTLKTGENNVNGLVLNAMALGLLFAGAALGNNARTELANNRRINTMLLANGFDWKKIRQIYNERSEKTAIASSLVAAPAIVGFDAMTNSGTPGAALGPNAVTFLCVLGTTWAASRIGTELAVRKEAKRNDLDKGYVL